MTLKTTIPKPTASGDGGSSGSGPGPKTGLRPVKKPKQSQDPRKSVRDPKGEKPKGG